MLKKSLFYSFLAPAIVCFLFNGTPCHSMEEQLEHEVTHVLAKAPDSDLNKSDSSKVMTFPKHTSPASGSGCFEIFPNEIMVYFVNFLRGPQILNLANASKDMDPVVRCATKVNLGAHLPRGSQEFQRLSFSSQVSALTLIDKGCPKEQLPHLFPTLELIEVLAPAFRGPDRKKFLQSSSNFIVTKIFSGQIPVGAKESYDMLKPAHLTFTRKVPQLVNTTFPSFEAQVENRDELGHRVIFSLTPAECEWFSTIISPGCTTPRAHFDSCGISRFKGYYKENENRLEFLKSLYAKIPENYGDYRFEILGRLSSAYHKIADSQEMVTLYLDNISWLLRHACRSDIIYYPIQCLSSNDYNLEMYKEYIQEVKRIIESTDPSDLKIQLIKDESLKLRKMLDSSNLMTPSGMRIEVNWGNWN